MRAQAGAASVPLGEETEAGGDERGGPEPPRRSCATSAMNNATSAENCVWPRAAAAASRARAHVGVEPRTARTCARARARARAAAAPPGARGGPARGGVPPSTKPAIASAVASPRRRVGRGARPAREPLERRVAGLAVRARERGLRRHVDAARADAVARAVERRGGGPQLVAKRRYAVPWRVEVHGTAQRSLALTVESRTRRPARRRRCRERRWEDGVDEEEPLSTSCQRVGIEWGQIF